MSDTTLNDITDRFNRRGLAYICYADVKYLIDELHLARKGGPLTWPELRINEPSPIEVRLAALERFAINLVDRYPNMLAKWEGAFK